MLDERGTGYLDLQMCAKIDCCIVGLLVRRSCPEIEVVAVRFALETTKRILGQVYGETATT